jgi:hypothetical protein
VLPENLENLEHLGFRGPLHLNLEHLENLENLVVL